MESAKFNMNICATATCIATTLFPSNEFDQRTNMHMLASMLAIDDT